ncbi:MAG TPA: helix-turn-helix domain-containing protein [Candidatus Baltobacteraceae bacterium]|nr:helix-turn-helix domain-containing protein [Candidatus Baltobacteraceae bacterium]
MSKTTTKTPDRLVSIAEAAEYLGVSERTVRNMMHDGRLKGHRLGGRVVRIRLSDIDAALEPWA